jgi:hypothetical protein
VRKFFLEAKKPLVNLALDSQPALQLRRYAWSAKLPLSVVANFRHLAMYDCRREPDQGDTPATARTMLVSYTELPERWDEIAAVLSKPSVLRGSFDRYAADKARRGSAEVDQAFLREMQAWRKALAEDIAPKNPSLGQSQLNYAVQQTLDRIIFLRICEDRGIEPYGALKDLLKGKGIYARLGALFLTADTKYNSGLFQFKTHPGRPNPDTITLGLVVSDTVLRAIIQRLYYPLSPYAFAVLPAEILGQVYEQFLGQLIVVTSKHRATIEDKPEVKKAGGVYYTPPHIVKRIVDGTLGPLLAGRTPSVLRRKGGALRILDPACGSGSFLLTAYQHLLDWHLDYYVTHQGTTASKGKNPKIRAGERPGAWQLTTAERKRILREHIFGVDIDAQAVEVTKLSLLLKVLEGESEQTLDQQMALFHEAALPDLEENVKCGNTLVSSDFDPGGDLTVLDSVNPFALGEEFDVVRTGGFQAIIGNPPWLMAGYFVQPSMAYFRSSYVSAIGKFDLYYLFLERCKDLLAPGGRLGMIVPNKCFHTGAAQRLRGWLSAENWLVEVVDFGAAKVFPKATNYSCLLFLEHGAKGDVKYSRAKADLTHLRGFSVPRNLLSDDPWHFHDAVTRALFERLRNMSTPLSALTARFGTGVQTGADRVYLMTAAEAKAEKIEPALLQRVLRGRDVRRFSVAGDGARVLLFPYRRVRGQFRILTPSQFAKYPVAQGYLSKERTRLDDRVWFGQSARDLAGRWYGMMYLEPLSSFVTTHLLTPSLSGRSNFAIGSGDLFVTGTAGVTSIVLDTSIKEDPRYIVGILNSTLLSVYAISHSPVFSGGYYKFSSPYLRPLPIRRIAWEDAGDRAIHDAVVSAVDSCSDVIADLQRPHTPADKAKLRRRLLTAETALDRSVNRAYGVTAAEAGTVQEILEQDAG